MVVDVEISEKPSFPMEKCKNKDDEEDDKDNLRKHQNNRSVSDHMNKDIGRPQKQECNVEPQKQKRMHKQMKAQRYEVIIFS